MPAIKNNPRNASQPTPLHGGPQNLPLYGQMTPVPEGMYGTTWLTQHHKGIPEVIPARIVEDDTTRAEPDTVDTSGRAKETTGIGVAGGGGTNPAGEWVEAEAISDRTMFLTKDPRSETTSGVRVVEVGMVGGGMPATDEELEVTVANVMVDERSEPEDMGQQVKIQ